MSKTNTNVKTETNTTQVADALKAAELIKEHGGVSKAIRALASSPEYQKDGKPNTGAIAKVLDKRYQHVRNVLTQPLKKSS